MKFVLGVYVEIWLLWNFVNVSQQTLSESDRKFKAKNKKTATTKQEDSQSTQSVPVLTWNQIVDFHDRVENLQTRNLNSTVLGYVTPWNNLGYDIPKKYGSKLTWLSPVWLQVKRIATSQSFRVEGGHDIDQGWIKEIKKKHPHIKFLPRLLFDGWEYPDYKAIFTSPDEPAILANTLAQFYHDNGFDGIVIEVWSQLQGHENGRLSKVLQQIAKSFKSHGMLVVLVIPPSEYYGAVPGYFNAQDFNLLSDDIDAFSLMTYDYSSVQRPGPNSPVDWVRKCVENLVPNPTDSNRQKILVGLNFYGYVFTSTGGGPLLGRDFVDILKKNKPKIQWDSSAKEHYLQFKDSSGKRTVFYPTAASVEARIELANQLNVGVSIWELGQGLDYFYDLL